MGMFQLLSHAQKEAILPAVEVKYRHSNVLSHLKHEDSTPQILQHLIGVGNAAI